jgi:hypothetical protein
MKARLILLWMRNISDRSCRENQNTHFTSINVPPPPPPPPTKKTVVPFIGWRSKVQPWGRGGGGTENNITQRMRFACWITKAWDLTSEHVILIALTLQKWLREYALLLRVCVYCLSYCNCEWLCLLCGTDWIIKCYLGYLTLQNIQNFM